MTSALRSGKGGPPVLAEVRVLEAFWTRFGVTEDQLRQWPPQKVRDYLTILHLEHTLNSEQQKSPAARGGAAGPQMSSSEMTEAAFQAMRQESANVSSQAVGPHPNAAVRAERAKLFE